MRTLAAIDAAIGVLAGDFRPFGALFLVDLPVDVVVVLEQQERAHQLQRPDETPRRLGFGR